MFLLIALAAFCMAGPLPGASLAAKGRELYLAGEYQKARSTLEQALKSRSSDAGARLWLGYTLLALEELEHGIRQLERIRPVMERDEEYLFALSEAYIRESRHLSQRLVRLGQKSARAQQHLAYRYYAEGNIKQAIERFRRAAALRPDLPGLHLELAEVMWEQQMYEQAAEELRSELALSPLDFLANLRYGQYLLRQKKHREALPHLEVASRYRKYAEAFQLLAFAYERIEDRARAAAVVDLGLKAFPEHEGLQEMRGSRGQSHPKLHLPALAEPTESLDELRRRLSGDPAGEDALFLLSRAYSVEGQMVFEQLEKLAPDSYRVLQGKGLEAEYAGSLLEAERYYRAWLEREPRLPAAHFAVGHVLRMQEKHSEAIPFLERAASLDPGNHLAHYALGASLIKLGRRDEGIPALERAARLRPAFAETRAELGKAYLQQGKARDAIAELLTAVELDAEHPSVHYLLFRAYILLRDKSSADKHLAKHQALLMESSPMVAEPVGMSP